MNARQETLVFVLQKDCGCKKVTLGLKDSKRFLGGKYNGFGGGVEGTETIKQCAIRETLEESEIDLTEEFMVPKGKITYIDVTSETAHVVYTYAAASFQKAKPTEEMKPEEFDITSLPFSQMQSTDVLWLPRMLMNGINFIGTMTFNSFGLQSINMNFFNEPITFE